MGLEVDRIDEVLFLCQQKYTIDMLHKFNMLECKQVSTPMETNTKICAHEGKELNNEMTYRQLVGSFIYLTLTRPNISYVIEAMSRYMQSPKKLHLDVA